MHRLITLSRTRIRSLTPPSLMPLVSFENFRLDRTCELCKQNNTYTRTLVRHQTTISNPNTETTSKKKRKRRSKKFAELLVVNDNSTLQQKAPIKKLTWNDLRLLASTNLTLSELYRLKEFDKNVKHAIEHTYNNLTIIENNLAEDAGSTGTDPVISLSPIGCEPGRESVGNDAVDGAGAVPAGIESATSDINVTSNVCDRISTNSESGVIEDGKVDAAGLEMEPEFYNGVPSSMLNVLHPEIFDDVMEEMEVTEEPKETSIKQSVLIKDTKFEKLKNTAMWKLLNCYIDVCNDLNIPMKGYKALMLHCKNSEMKKPLKRYPPISRIEVYNAALRGFSQEGNLDKVIDILTYAKREGAELNLQSYVYIFECLGRINMRNSHLKEIRIFAKQAVHSGYTFDRIMNEGLFLNDERDFVLQTMVAYDRNYIPVYEKPVLKYNCKLVDSLNSDLQEESYHKTEFVENGGLFTPEFMDKAIQRQLKMEQSHYITITSIEKKPELTKKVFKNRETLSEIYDSWEKEILKEYNRKLQDLHNRRTNRASSEPFLKSIPSKDVLKIVIDEARKLVQGSETFSPTLNQLYNEIGRKVYSRYLTLKKQKGGIAEKICEIHKPYCEDYAANHPKLSVLPVSETVFNPRQKWQWFAHHHKRDGATLIMDHQEWTPPILWEIGKFLYSIILNLKFEPECMKPDERSKQSAFFRIFRNSKAKFVTLEQVKPHPNLVTIYRSAMFETLEFPACEVPMLCPPLPWINVHQQGGYLNVPCDLIRLPSQASCQLDRIKESSPQMLYPALDALNQLSTVPWKINERVLDLIIGIFNSGGDAKLEVPVNPELPDLPETITDKEKKEMYSLWCDCLYKLSLANHFRKDVFWLPHNMDFRGRVYPVPPHLNHLGSDLARSLLLFAEPRPLGPKGLDWLKIHLVNLTGLKKRDPVEKRLEYANEILDEILDSADNPLSGRRWWAESEEPWQTLACCMEVTEASRSPDPEKYLSHYPVHQDGSCNGLQHYAALGRDSAGAHSVNLSPDREPQDVYSAVVNLVEEQREQDARNGLEIAKQLEGCIKRKVIKQTIMTTVYGVTKYGARLQIVRQLKDAEFPEELRFRASSYLTDKTFKSLATMFTSSREIQEWFTECAKTISGSGQLVEWVTPLDLPIVQPYIKYRKLTKSKYCEAFHIDKLEKPLVQKQKNAFPPNYIHSLDSSHMMLTSLFSERKNITFVSVHDCFWTHASTVHIMNKICREQFVALHSEPLLENLSLFFIQKYGTDESEEALKDLTKKRLNMMIRKVPKTGDFDIEEVLKSVYFFS